MPETTTPTAANTTTRPITVAAIEYQDDRLRRLPHRHLIRDDRPMCDALIIGPWWAVDERPLPAWGSEADVCGPCRRALAAQSGR